MKLEYTQQYLTNILKNVKTIAIVGASSKEKRDSFKVMKNLIKNGYEVFPVNPNEAGRIILVRYVYRFRRDTYDIDMVDVFRAKEAVMDVANKQLK